ncbi:transporter [Aliiroseovarius zhejiangensis]|uniref:Transporter n=1 Tax=Aliiroseovarius zhejiangensis TaxID=1632025 RepID=A0ABQ3IV15_9RHOB|nr:permease [Aliiroseovarius zhejiangensis]GHE89972.1 transporter [Aliiroseovarius zhejiangensis]
MAETTQTQPPARRWRIDKAWVAILAIPAGLTLFAPQEVWPTITFALSALMHTAPFILFAILAVAYLKATGAENLLARAFEGREARMIVLAAFAGGLSPFCSCEVIPFIAALLAVGAPLGAVMAFWLSSPLMDPAMFAITAGTLGTGFAVAKTFAAVSIGLFGGFTVKAMAKSALFADPLKNAPAPACCSSSGCGAGSGADVYSGEVQWRFWTDRTRRASFRSTAFENALFLSKWLLLAYMIEALMLRYVPADLVAQVLGGTGIGPILLAALVGAPAYLNGYAAVPMVAALLDQGMSNGAAMSFVIAGGVSCIPAAVAVWALVKPRVFAAYLGLAMVGAIVSGLVWGTVA